MAGQAAAAGSAADYSDTTYPNSGNHRRGRGAKRTKSLNIKLSESVNSLLEDWCDKTGQSKTVAVERALIAYCKNASLMQTDR